MKHAHTIARELSIAPWQVQAVEDLFTGGATVPFIARYRKEAHGSLDEVAITGIRDRLTQLQDLDARKKAVLKSLTERGLLTETLAAGIAGAATMNVLEDLYLPYRPKKRTRAMIAREKGLEPLARLLFEQSPACLPEKEAAGFLSEEHGVADAALALAGARDIMAEWIAEDADIRSRMRELFAKKAVISSKVGKGKEETGAKFQDYFDWQEPVARAAGHRLLAMFRGENEGVLSLNLAPDVEEALGPLRRMVIKNASPAAEEVALAMTDSYKRLLGPSMETELRAACKERAEREAITVFAQNLRELLLAPPLGQKRTLALDPGLRTGCKIACMDAQGALLHNDVIYLLSPQQRAEAEKTVTALCARYAVEAIAIGNGTGSRETETFIRGLGLKATVVVVSESGASVYSASEIARKEFPDLDLTGRGAVSIGRRLMDPLAELVKIDPKAIGVGQYQHDVDQTALKNSLNDVVVSCVNAVGVALNTASAALLTHVSGLGPALAQSIVDYREKNGPFKRRKELLKVPRLGPKAFEQAAAFLRIPGGENPLDASAVHPESYSLVERMAKDLRCELQDLIRKGEIRQKIAPERYVTETFGLPTITDILKELEKPGRDPRQEFAAFAFNEGVTTMSDLVPGMRLPGIITNVTNFGAFVDIGVHQDGLVHISQLADAFVSDPHTVARVHQHVMVTVQSVDIPRKRIALSMRSQPDPEEVGAARRSTAPAPAGGAHQQRTAGEGTHPGAAPHDTRRDVPPRDARRNQSRPAEKPQDGEKAPQPQPGGAGFHTPFAGLRKK